MLMMTTVMMMVVVMMTVVVTDDVTWNNIFPQGATISVKACLMPQLHKGKVLPDPSDHKQQHNWGLSRQ